MLQEVMRMGFARTLGRRGQGLPLNTIIIALIVIIVLVVIILITTGQLNIWQRGASAAGDFSCYDLSDDHFCSMVPCDQVEGASSASGACGVGLVCCQRSGGGTPSPSGGPDDAPDGAR
jgi:hypothetical protein